MLAHVATRKDAIEDISTLFVEPAIADIRDTLRQASKSLLEMHLVFNKHNGCVLAIDWRLTTSHWQSCDN